VAERVVAERMIRGLQCGACRRRSRRPVPAVCGQGRFEIVGASADSPSRYERAALRNFVPGSP